MVSAAKLAVTKAIIDIAANQQRVNGQPEWTRFLLFLKTIRPKHTAMLRQ